MRMRVEELEVLGGEGLGGAGWVQGRGFELLMSGDGRGQGYGMYNAFCL